MSCKEIGDKIELNLNTIRTLLCRQEFNKYVTFHRDKGTRKGICFHINKSFLQDLLDLMETKHLYKQINLVGRWINEYNRIF